VITVLNEGTAVNVQAVVSNDRRFVRLTLVPFFSQIGRVEQFQFEGTRSTKSKSSDEKTGLAGEANAGGGLQAGLETQAKADREEETFSRGTTIQLPEFIFTTVTTTVSVPDGGTVLLGGIKRLRVSMDDARVGFAHRARDRRFETRLRGAHAACHGNNEARRERNGRNKQRGSTPPTEQAPACEWPERPHRASFLRYPTCRSFLRRGRREER
jgi:hypothetical protein